MRLLDSLSDNWKLKTWPKLSCSIQNYRSLLPAIENPKSKIQNPLVGLSIFAFVLVVGGAVADAQQPTKVARIGFLSASSPEALSSRIEAFRQGLRELGYVVGKNIVIERRSAG